MMGLTRRDAEHRLDAVLEFAELDEFVDLKLKNYSSGMLVRLAFAVMVQADADIMLIDEVLAVGDAAFAQKCMDVFHQKRDAGKTLVLVTHDMATVQSFCDRATLLHDGKQLYTGNPEEAALRYYRLNFGGAGEGERAQMPSVPDVNVKLIDTWLEDAHGERIENVEQGEPIRFHLIAEARHELVRPVFSFHFLNCRRRLGLPLGRDGIRRGGAARACAAGERVRISGTIENPLHAGPLLRRVLDIAGGSKGSGGPPRAPAAQLPRLWHTGRPGQRLSPGGRRGRARAAAAGVSQRGRRAATERASRAPARSGRVTRQLVELS